MPTIDADAHVIETERTWDFMEPGDQKHRPVIVTPRGEAGKEYWMCEGTLWGAARFSGRDFKELSKMTGRNMDAPRETREMEDIRGRLAHMDELEVDVQVLYPTIFISSGATRAEVDVAVCRGYNRWLANIYGQSEGRLPWVCMPPLLSMNDAIDELRWSKERGAIGVFMRCVEGPRVLHDPYFFPLYEEAERLGMPITVHIANSNNGMTALLSQHSRTGTFWGLRLALVGSCHALILNGIPDKFPKLRFGFIEGAAQWVPYALNDLQRRMPGLGASMGGDVFKASRIYITCQTDDDIPYLMDRAGEDNFLIGTDYGHNDQSSELEALRVLRTGGRLSADRYERITYHNPKALYGL